LNADSAPMNIGGFLCIGDEYRALPWNSRHYNEQLDAYELNVTDNQLRNAPVLTGRWRAESTVNGNGTITKECHPTGERCTVLKWGGAAMTAPPLERVLGDCR
jgi:hypothetical protein